MTEFQQETNKISSFLAGKEDVYNAFGDVQAVDNMPKSWVRPEKSAMDYPEYTRGQISALIEYCKERDALHKSLSKSVLLLVKSFEKFLTDLPDTVIKQVQVCLKKEWPKMPDCRM